MDRSVILLPAKGRLSLLFSIMGPFGWVSAYISFEHAVGLAAGQMGIFSLLAGVLLVSFGVIMFWLGTIAMVFGPLAVLIVGAQILFGPRVFPDEYGNIDVGFEGPVSDYFERWRTDD